MTNLSTFLPFSMSEEASSPLFCSSPGQILCCLRASQCPSTRPPPESQLDEGGCYVDELNKSKKNMAKYIPSGFKVPCR